MNRIIFFALILNLSTYSFAAPSATNLVGKSCADLIKEQEAKFCKENPGENPYRYLKGFCEGNKSSGGACKNADCATIVGPADLECSDIKTADLQPLF